MRRGEGCGKEVGNGSLFTTNPRYRYNVLTLVGVKIVARLRFPSLLSIPREHNLTKSTLKKNLSVFSF